MVGFGRKQAWLAVRGDDPVAVIGGLGVLDLGEVGWRDGLDLVHLTDDRLAVTPALPGARDASWVLVVGRHLLTAFDAPEVVALSAALGTEVQYFATHRVGELHRWGRAVDGVLVRDFGFLGETGEVIRWRGDPDEAERGIGLPLDLPAPGVDPDILLGEADVMHLAAAWSVDPTALDGRPSPGPLRIAAA
jgi:hypothetical protein